MSSRILQSRSGFQLEGYPLCGPNCAADRGGNSGGEINLLFCNLGANCTFLVGLGSLLMRKGIIQYVRPAVLLQLMPFAEETISRLEQDLGKNTFRSLNAG